MLAGQLAVFLFFAAALERAHFFQLFAAGIFGLAVFKLLGVPLAAALLSGADLGGRAVLAGVFQLVGAGAAAGSAGAHTAFFSHGVHVHCGSRVADAVHGSFWLGRCAAAAAWAWRAGRGRRNVFGVHTEDAWSGSIGRARRAGATRGEPVEAGLGQGIAKLFGVEGGAAGRGGDLFHLRGGFRRAVFHVDEWVAHVGGVGVGKRLGRSSQNASPLRLQVVRLIIHDVGDVRGRLFCLGLGCADGFGGCAHKWDFLQDAGKRIKNARGQLSAKHVERARNKGHCG